MQPFDLTVNSLNRKNFHKLEKRIRRGSRAKNRVPNTNTSTERFPEKMTVSLKSDRREGGGGGEGQVRSIEAGESEPDGPVGTCWDLFRLVQVHWSDPGPGLWKKIMHGSTEKKGQKGGVGASFAP